MRGSFEVHYRRRFWKRRSGLWLTGLATVILGLAAGVQLILLRYMHYSTSMLERVPPASLLVRPRPEFALGSLVWEVRHYGKDRSLSPLRKAFRKYCGDQKGVDAALRLSEEFARKSPFQTERNEFFQPGYDPVQKLAAVEGGAATHCVGRSGLITAILLSAEIPARVVQFLPWEVNGHNILEVWDQRLGWVLVDPSYGCLVGNEDGPCSAVTLLRDPTMARWYPRVAPPAEISTATDVYREGKGRLIRGNIVFPEPWLYMRSGKRASFWPFRGKFAIVGPANWRLGTGQNVLQHGSLVCGLSSIFLLIFGLVQLLWRSLVPVKLHSILGNGMGYIWHRKSLPTADQEPE